MKRLFVSTIVAICLLATTSQAQDFTMACKKSLHSVVYIQCAYRQNTATYFDDFFDNDFFSQFFNFDPFAQSRPKQKSKFFYHTAGSGVIISNDGYIVTNHHVVADADTITVTLNDRRVFSATIVGSDANNDLAVIKIDATDLEPITYGNSDNVEVGEWVLAVGNPFNLTSTVTAGIVSAKARNINILSSKGSTESLTSFIQTDAAMNPGNSGGALVNTDGELIGINAAISSNTGSYTGYSFAIPVNIVKKVVSDIIQYGQTQIANAGLITTEIDAQLQADKHLKDNNGMYIESVLKGGASDKADIKAGDVITKINGKDVHTASQMLESMTQLSPNETAVFTIRRGEEILTKNVTLSSQSAADELANKQNGNVVEVLGAKIRTVTDKEMKEYNLDGGLYVVSVEKGKLKENNINSGFIITSIDGKSNLTLSDATNLNKRKGRIQMEGFYPKTGLRYFIIMVL